MKSTCHIRQKPLLCENRPWILKNELPVKLIFSHKIECTSVKKCHIATGPVPYNTTYFVHLDDLWFGGSLLHLAVSFLKKSSTLKAGPNVWLAFRTHDGVEAGVAAPSVEAVALIRVCWIGEFLCMQ